MVEREAKQEFYIDGKRYVAHYYDRTGWRVNYTNYDANGVPYSDSMSKASLERLIEAFKEKLPGLEKKKRRYGLEANLSTGSITFLGYLQYFLEDILRERCEPVTVMVYSYTLYKHIAPVLEEDVKLSHVTDTILNQILRALKKQSKCAANKAREFMYLALKEAVKESRITAIPKMIKCPRDKSNIVVLNKDEMRAFLKVASTDNWYLEYLLGLFVGLRKGEILGLKFADFDYDTESVYIQRQLSRMVIMEEGDCQTKAVQQKEKEPKTINSTRRVYVPAIVFNELEKRKETVEKNKAAYKELYMDNDYVSCTEVGEGHSPSAMNIALTKLCARNGFKHLTVHSLRHTYATILLEKCEYDLAIISAVLGHASVKTTFETYASIMDANSDITEILNDLYEQEGNRYDENN